MTVVAGIDGYGRGAWVAVVLRDGAFAEARVGPTLDELRAKLAAAVVVAIDIPIGLSDRGGRRADVLARAYVGKRRASVFMTPTRAVLQASSHAGAMAVARATGEKGLSQQAFAIGPRIFEAERTVRTGAELHEVHPEASFTAMAGGPLDWAKLSYRGAVLRRELLAGVGIVLPADIGEANAVPTDDVLDAAAAAWSARRIAAGTHVLLPDPPEVFSDGLAAVISV